MNSSNSTLDDLITTYLSDLSINQFERDTVLKNIQEHLKEELVTIPILFPNFHFGISCRLNGLSLELFSEDTPNWEEVAIDYTTCPQSYIDIFSSDLNALEELSVTLFPGQIALISTLVVTTLGIIAFRANKKVKSLRKPKEEIYG